MPRSRHCSRARTATCSSRAGRFCTFGKGNNGTPRGGSVAPSPGFVIATSYARRKIVKMTDHLSEEQKQRKREQARLRRERKKEHQKWQAHREQQKEQKAANGRAVARVRKLMALTTDRGA